MIISSKFIVSHIAGCIVWLVAVVPLEAAITHVGDVEFRGEIHEPENISGLAVVGNYLLIGSDEGNHIQVLEKISASVYKVAAKPVQLADEATETDVEGIAASGDRVYVVGSHSTKRKKVKKNKTRKKNRKRMKEVEHEESRDQVFELKVDPQSGGVKPESSMSLVDNIRQDELLKLFVDIPSKENGIDIEGIAADGDKLFFGFRGPILRGNYVPVMIRQRSSPSHELRFVNLGGLGIRDMARVKDGFLILAGPMGDGPGSYSLYFWTGEDDIPGRDNTMRAIAKLGDFPTIKNGKAEGLAVISENSDSYTVLVVFDSLPKGKPTLFTADKTQTLQ